MGVVIVVVVEVVADSISLLKVSVLIGTNCELIESVPSDAEEVGVLRTDGCFSSRYPANKSPVEVDCKENDDTTTNSEVVEVASTVFLAVEELDEVVGSPSPLSVATSDISLTHNSVGLLLPQQLIQI